MPLKVTFELSDKDLKYFAKKAAEVAARAIEADEDTILAGAAKLVASMSKETPVFVRDRVEKLELMVAMLRDEMWQLTGQDRERVLKAVAYFAEPEDLIPDEIPVLGLIDDAVMIELVVRELRHELDAYDDFRKVQKNARKRVKKAVDRETWVTLRRKQLQERMRRRRRRDRAVGSGGGGFRLRLF